MGLAPSYDRAYENELFEIDKQLAMLGGPSSTSPRQGELSNYQKNQLMSALMRKRQSILDSRRDVYDPSANPFTQAYTKGSKAYNQNMEARRLMTAMNARKAEEWAATKARYNNE